MKVAIVGSRAYLWPENIKIAIDYLQEHHQGWSLISGGSGIVDLSAAEYARLLGVKVTEVQPDWTLGKTAGKIRNDVVIGRADVVIAFWDGTSPGTKNDIALARELKKQLFVIGQ